MVASVADAHQAGPARLEQPADLDARVQAAADQREHDATGGLKQISIGALASAAGHAAADLYAHARREQFRDRERGAQVARVGLRIEVADHLPLDAKAP